MNGVNATRDTRRKSILQCLAEPNLDAVPVFQFTIDRYHRLIESFFGLTGAQMLLNTSFDENEPVVCRPEEALDCFMRTEMDMLVIGSTVVSRQAAQ